MQEFNDGLYDLRLYYTNTIQGRICKPVSNIKITDTFLQYEQPYKNGRVTFVKLDSLDSFYFEKYSEDQT